MGRGLNALLFYATKRPLRTPLRYCLRGGAHTPTMLAPVMVSRGMWASVTLRRSAGRVGISNPAPAVWASPFSSSLPPRAQRAVFQTHAQEGHREQVVSGKVTLRRWAGVIKPDEKAMEQYPDRSVSLHPHAFSRS